MPPIKPLIIDKMGPMTTRKNPGIQLIAIAPPKMSTAWSFKRSRKPWFRPEKKAQLMIVVEIVMSTKIEISTESYNLGPRWKSIVGKHARTEWLAAKGAIASASHDTQGRIPNLDFSPFLIYSPATLKPPFDLSCNGGHELWDVARELILHDAYVQRLLTQKPVREGIMHLHGLVLNIVDVENALGKTVYVLNLLLGKDDDVAMVEGRDDEGFVQL